MSAFLLTATNCTTSSAGDLYLENRVLYQSRAIMNHFYSPSGIPSRLWVYNLYFLFLTFLLYIFLSAMLLFQFK